MHFTKITLLTVVFLSLLLLLGCAFSLPMQQPEQQSNNETSKLNCQKLEETCSLQRGKPYVWGKEGPNAFDCSGFVHYVAKLMGSPLPRTTSKKYWFLIESKSIHWSKGRCGHIVWWTLSPDRPYGHIGVMVKSPRFWQSGSSHGVYSRKFFKGSFWDEHFSGAKDYL